MSNLYSGPSIDASYQVSVHLAKRFQRRKFKKNWPIKNKNCLWWPFFFNGSGQDVQSLERTSYRCFLPSFSSFGWGFLEKKIEIWKVNGRRTPSDGKSSLCLRQGELRKENRYIGYRVALLRLCHVHILTSNLIQRRIN